MAIDLPVLPRHIATSLEELRWRVRGHVVATSLQHSTVEEHTSERLAEVYDETSDHDTHAPDGTSDDTWKT